MTAKTFTIDGSMIHSIPSFYDELNRVFMADEDWKLGASLDALNDFLFGGYGALVDVTKPIIVWKCADQSRTALGIAATRIHYISKLESGKFDSERLRQDLEDIDRGEGPTYFEIILEIFAEHPDITLRLE